MVVQPIASPRTPTTAPERPRALRGKRRWLRRLFGGELPGSPEPGARAGDYVLDVVLSRGGMGEVWLATHRRTGARAAVKFLSVDARPGTPSWNTSAQRLELEAQIMASLPDRHIPAVYEVGRWHDGTPFYAMELIDGADLQTLVKDTGPIEAGRVAALLRGLAGALADAHARGIVHRDVKPANVMLSGDDLKLIDFGVAHEPTRALGLTHEGAMVGTPAYMPPEAVMSAEPVSASADIYGLGCVAYYLLTGRAPFDGNTPPEVLYKHVHHTPSPLPASVPSPLARLVERCLNKQPTARPSAAELEAELAAL